MSKVFVVVWNVFEGFSNSLHFLFLCDGILMPSGRHSNFCKENHIARYTAQIIVTPVFFYIIIF